MSSPESSSSKVQDLFREIVEKSSQGEYIYRGEPECFPKISSTLYRQYENEIDAEEFEIEIAQKEMLEHVKIYTHFTDEADILTELQHYGGQTNLIDFTTDYLIAMFFACDSSYDEDGRVILYDRTSRYHQIKAPKKNQNSRVISQKSIFIQSPTGWIADSEVEIVSIPKELKQAVMEHLMRFNGISIATIYNDMLGYIQNQEKHQTAYAEFFIGNTCVEKGEYEKAISHFDETIRLNPNVISAYVNRGIAKAQLGEHEKAITDYSAALEFDPRNAGVFYNRGYSYRSLARTEEAIADFSEAIQIDPKHLQAYNNRGGAQSDLGLNEEAITDFSEAIQIDPNNADLFNNRGAAKASGGKPEEGIADFDEAIRLNPEFAEAFLKRGAVKVTLKHYEEAISDFNETIRLDPNRAKAYYLRGYAAHSLGRNAAAQKDLECALSLAKESGDEEILHLVLDTLDSLNCTSI